MRRPGSSTPPQNGLGTTAWPSITMSQPGISRSPPISQPRYQSGCAPFVADPRGKGPRARSG